jgi:uncharacterized protein YdgA (DUF945 family)
MENNNKIKQKPLTENGQIKYNGQNVKNKHLSKEDCIVRESNQPPNQLPH